MTRFAKSFLGLSLVTFATYGLLVALGMRHLVVGDPPMRPLDLRPLGYSQAEVVAYLEALPAAAVALYLGTIRLIDTVFPLLFGAWMGWALWGLTHKIHAWSRVILLVVPGSYVIMDLAENALIGQMLRAGADGVSATMVQLASAYTISKYVSLGVALAMLLVLSVARRRRMHVGSSLFGRDGQNY